MGRGNSDGAARLVGPCDPALSDKREQGSGLGVLRLSHQHDAGTSRRGLAHAYVNLKHRP